MNNAFIKWVEDYTKEKLKRFTKRGLVSFTLCSLPECSRSCEKGLLKKRQSEDFSGGEFRNFRATYMIIPGVIPCVLVSPYSCGGEDQQVDYIAREYMYAIQILQICAFSKTLSKRC